MYTPSDVRGLVDYAADRGVRIVPEVDIPAHTAAWGRGRPGVLVWCNATGGGGSDVKLLDKYALDPTSSETHALLADVFGEVAGMFPDSYIHVGGDEVCVGVLRGSLSVYV